jgi:uncharacterized membrane protein YhaH (DUF805 family)
VPIKPGKYSRRDYFGLALSFTVTMIVSIMITSWCGKWLDAKLGTPGVFWLLGVLGGIYSGFHLFIEQIDRIENPIDPDERAPKDW